MPNVSPALALGSHARWSRDFALLGALSAGLVPLVALATADPPFVPVYFAVIATIIGTASGALVGLVARSFIGGLGGRLPIGLLLLAGPLVGAVWGALTGSSAIYLWWCHSNTGAAPMALIVESAWFAGIAAAVQFGWFWLPYLLGKARHRATRGLWILAGVSAAAIGLLLRGIVV